MLAQEIIRRKRDGGTLTGAEINHLIKGLVTGDVSDSQAAAFAMAIFFQGMNTDERAALTLAMRDSGARLRWDHLDGPAVDKHSTGGVGDTVSLMLAPALAACGAYVPMISGRGLGHTGGTLDKLDAIPGYRSQPSVAEFRDVVGKCGCAIIGQTADLAPADRRLYAIRDVTATVESIPLITASILSKKLAAGLSGLVMDVKVGSGAFMADVEGATALAESLAKTAAQAGLPTVCVLTDMSEPLANAAGNALEVRYAIDYLTGKHREEKMHDVVLALGAELLVLGRLAETPQSAQRLLDDAIADGAAADHFERMVALLGGPSDLLSAPDTHLARAPLERDVYAGIDGVVAEIDTRALGLAVVELGGGRRRADDTVDPAVGLTHMRRIGDAVGTDHPLARVHASSNAAWEQAASMIRGAYRVVPAGEVVKRPETIVRRITA